MSLVPTVLEKEGNSERAMDLYSRLLKIESLWLPVPLNQIWQIL